MPNKTTSEAMEEVAKVQNLGFVQFTTDLVENVYNVITDSSLKQLKAYGDLVAQVSKPLIEYQKETTGITFDDAQMLSSDNSKQLDNYINEVLGFATTNANYTLKEDEESLVEDHFQGVKIKDGSTQKTVTESITGTTTKKISKTDLQKFVYEKLAQSTTESYNMLITVLKLGMQKVEVTEGTIHTKLVFHIDASDSISKQSNEIESKANSWGIKGRTSAKWGWGRASISGGYQASNVKVKVVNEKSSSAVNLSTDIIGSVTLKFRSGSFPSYEIQ